MRISKFFNLYALIFLLIVSAYQIQLIFRKPILIVSKQSSSLNVNSNFMTKANLGHKRLLSSLFWIMTILESDHEHYKKKDLNSWMYLRFKLISDLEPEFIQTYLFGGLYLSIIKDDIAGATEIYRKGLLLFPDNVQLIKDAFFHFYFQTDEKEFAKNLLRSNLNIIKDDPLLISLLARNEAQAGNLQIAFKLLNEKLESTPIDSPLYLKLNNSLYAIKAEIDLNCLNGKVDKSCDRFDFENEPYYLKDQKYLAKKSWIPFRTKK